MDIILGARGIKTVDWRETLATLEKQISQEQQFLQSLRRTFASDEFVRKAPPEVIEAKRKKMEEVKNKIVKLEFEINKIKMEHK